MLFTFLVQSQINTITQPYFLTPTVTSIFFNFTSFAAFGPILSVTVTCAHVHICIARVQGSPEFLRLEGFTERRTGLCDQEARTSLYYTPTREANGSLLMCAVVASLPAVYPENAVVKEIKILPRESTMVIERLKSLAWLHLNTTNSTFHWYFLICVTLVCRVSQTARIFSKYIRMLKMFKCIQYNS